MLIRPFVPGQESPGVLATGSSHKPYAGTYGEAGSPMLTQMLGIQSNIDYGENSDYPETDYGRAFTHFYGFEELRPQGESLLTTDQIDVSLEGELYMEFNFPFGGECHSAKKCGDAVVYRGQTCDPGRIAAVGYANRPYVFAPPLSGLAFAKWAGGKENGTTQNLETAEGGWFGFTQYYTTEPGTGPQSGEEFLDNSQEHPLVLVDGAWSEGTAAETVIDDGQVYDPTTFEFVDHDTGQDLEAGHQWMEDFDHQTVVVEDSNEIMFWLRPWPELAKLDNGYAHLTKVPDPADPSSEASGDPMDMTFYALDTTLTVPGSGDFPDDELHTRGLAYTRFRLHPTYNGRNPLIAPWGDVDVDDAGGDPPGYKVLDEEEDFGCRSINDTLDGLRPESEIVTCGEQSNPVLGFALYMQLDEDYVDFYTRFLFAYNPTDGVLSWPNMIEAMHAYEYDQDKGEWYKTLNCKSTLFAAATGGGGGTHEYLFDNDPAEDLTEVFACGQEGYGVIWPTPDNPVEFPNFGPPGGWGCDDGIEIGGYGCDWPHYVDGRTNIKMVTEEEPRTWDFLEYDLHDLMFVKDSLITSKDCDRENTLAWHYCPCRCPECGVFFFSDIEYYTDLIGSPDAPCGEDFTQEAGVSSTLTTEAKTIDLADLTVLPGWYRFEVEVDPFYSSAMIFYSPWGDACVLSAGGVCEDEFGGGLLPVDYQMAPMQLVLENRDTEKQGRIDLADRGLVWTGLGFSFGLEPAINFYESGPNWSSDSHEKTRSQYTCTDGHLSLEECDFYGYGGRASLWQLSILNQEELRYEVPYEDPFNDFEPNGALWRIKELDILEYESPHGCPETEELFDAICFSDLYGPTLDVCGSNGEDQLALGCLEAYEPACLPTDTTEEIDSFGPTSYSYDLRTYFRGLS